MTPPALTPTASAVSVSSAEPIERAEAAAEPKGTFASVVELTKPRITRLVTITSTVGFVMAALGREDGWMNGQMALAAVGATIGTAVSAAGANALNECWERPRDAIMPRTWSRPLPQRRVSMPLAISVGLALSAAGVLLLWAVNGAAPALVSLVTILSYVLIYTPLKPVTPLATLVGAVPGALPPLIGWSAAILVNSGLSGFEAIWAPLSGDVAWGGWGGWALFTLMFVWQIPHFLAIAWMYKDDYAKGGYKVLPVVDPTGTTTASVILLWTATLLVATLGPAVAMPDQLGTVYLTVAILTGVPFFFAAVRLAKRRMRTEAKHVFLASIAHLPLLLVAMVADGLIGAL